MYNFQKKLPKSFNFVQDSDEKPCEGFIPGQSYELSELIRRFNSGQRLGVHLNFNPESEIGHDESFEQAPPENVVDIVDVQKQYEEHNRTKQEFEKRKKANEKKPEANEDAEEHDKDDKPSA